MVEVTLGGALAGSFVRPDGACQMPHPRKPPTDENPSDPGFLPQSPRGLGQTRSLHLPAPILPQAHYTSRNLDSPALSPSASAPPRRYCWNRAER